MGASASQTTLRRTREPGRRFSPWRVPAKPCVNWGGSLGKPLPCRSQQLGRFVAKECRSSSSRHPFCFLQASCALRRRHPFSLAVLYAWKLLPPPKRRLAFLLQILRHASRHTFSDRHLVTWTWEAFAPEKVRSNSRLTWGVTLGFAH